MKKFFKFFAAIAAVVAAVVGALVVFDKLKNKNRIKDGYLECDMPEEPAEEE